MKEEYINQFIQILLPVLATFLTGVFTYIGTKLKSAYEQKANNQTAKQVVADVVLFVQQVYKDLDGPEKLRKAIEQASTILASKGINLTEAEINMLIESSVYSMKLALTDNTTILNITNTDNNKEDIEVLNKTLEEAKEENKEVEEIKEEELTNEKSGENVNDDDDLVEI